ncbi:glycosyltransferase family 9 protein, partial [Lutimonas sp.]|uniref:glycosyltransferase family 9 protein n=1 Tax=Lutimonas sp. TaxID=1872403 RepID=UPI003C770049
MKPSQHILVLRLSAMGDVAMMVPLFRSLFKKYPTLRLTLVSRPLFKPIFKEFDRLDFFAVDLNERHKGPLGLWRLYQDLKALNPTAVADLHSVLRTHVIDFFFKTSGYKVAQIDKGRP